MKCAKYNCHKCLLNIAYYQAVRQLKKEKKFNHIILKKIFNGKAVGTLMTVS